MASMANVIGVFAKQPVPGRVKTRLGASIGNEMSARLYGTMVRDYLDRIRRVSADLVVACAEESEREYFESIVLGDVSVMTQRGADLGQRMENFFADLFDSGATRVVLTGTDAPDVPMGHITEAFAQLETNDLVLGPADDGGYYLIGMSRLVREAFIGIEWSTARVLEQTIERLQARHTKYVELGTWSDVDTIDDLFALKVRVERDTGMAKELEATIKLIDEILWHRSRG